MKRVKGKAKAGICKTDCPYKRKNVVYIYARVGSFGCFRCIYYVGVVKNLEESIEILCAAEDKN